jgi:hypothetical protein
VAGTDPYDRLDRNPTLRIGEILKMDGGSILQTRSGQRAETFIVHIGELDEYESDSERRNSASAEEVGGVERLPPRRREV